jgi:ribosomal protein S18 acetylase RimI-like enzyme
MSEIVILRASLLDTLKLAPLFDAYRSFYGQAPDPEGARRFLEDRLGRRESSLLFAEEEGEALGFAQLYPSFSSVRMRSALILNDLYVIPAARRRGVARELLSAARVLAQDHGAAMVQLETACANAAAQALYLGEGYVQEQGFEHYVLEV